MIGLRRAAAALHPLHAEDRRSMLAALPEHERKAIEGLLAELDELGFQAGAGEPLRAPSPAPVAAAPDTAAAPAAPPSTPSDLIRLAAPAQLFQVLEREPNGVIARLICLSHWPWIHELLALFPPQRRQQLRVALEAAGGPALARDAFLLEAVATRLAAAVPAAAAPAARRPGLLQALTRKVPAWTR